MLVPGIDLIRLFFKRIFLKRNPLSSDRFHLHHLLLSKYSYKKTIIILIALIIFPILMNYFGLNKLFVIFFFQLYIPTINFNIIKKVKIICLLALFFLNNNHNIL